ncbi:MAG: helix-turn-helix domain-containing protein [Thermoplasmataceae archaeon]
MIKDIASELHTRPNTVIQWRDRYLRNGLNGLYDDQRTGKPKKYPEDLKIKIVKLTEPLRGIECNDRHGGQAW